VNGVVDHLGEEGSGLLQRKLLLQDVDLTNTRALKDVLDEKVEHLERVIASHDEMVSGLSKRQGYAKLARKAACCCDYKPVNACYQSVRHFEWAPGYGNLAQKAAC
jgi:hypothetical protein